LILSRLVQVFEEGDSPQSRLVCGVEGEYGTAESLIFATDLFLPSLAVFVDVDGVHEELFVAFKGIAVGRALKNRWE